METSISLKADHCPKCGRQIDNWSSWEIEDESVGIPFECPCGFFGIQWSRLSFDAFTTTDGEYVFQK